VQKQPSRLPLVHAPVALDPAFPIHAYHGRPQDDRPITYLHGHDCLEIGYCRQGAGIFMVGSKILPFRAGDVIVIAGEMHLAQSLPGTVFLPVWIYLDPARLVRAVPEDHDALVLTRLRGRNFRNVLSPREHPEVATLVTELIAELDHDRPGRRAAVRGLTLALLARLVRLAPPHPARGEQPADAVERVAPALAHFAQQYGEPLRVAEAARLCRTSVTHFRRLFLHATGRTPLAYLNELRIRMAMGLLAGTRKPVLEVSLEVGFPTLSSFNRHFRRLAGNAPRKWRKLHA
jgi:AraC-like DNA-binding protein